MSLSLQSAHPNLSNFFHRLEMDGLQSQSIATIVSKCSASIVFKALEESGI